MWTALLSMAGHEQPDSQSCALPQWVLVASAPPFKGAVRKLKSAAAWSGARLRMWTDTCFL
jgi:hypothetical protein